MQIRVHVGEFFIHLLDGDGNSIVVTLATDKKNLMAGVVVSSWRGGGRRILLKLIDGDVVG